MPYKSTNPTYNVNRKVANFGDFTSNIDKEEEKLKKVKRSFTPNSDRQQFVRNSRTEYNPVTHKLTDYTEDEVEDKIKAIEELEETNENIDDDFDMTSSHLDDESIGYYKNEKQKIKKILENVLDDISGELDEFTTAVSGEININDTLYSSFGDYEYQIKIKRIS